VLLMVKFTCLIVVGIYCGVIGQISSINSVAISADGQYVVAGDNSKIYVFNQSGYLLGSYRIGDWIESVAISSDGRYVVAGSHDFRVYFFELRPMTSVNYIPNKWLEMPGFTTMLTITALFVAILMAKRKVNN